MSAKPKSKHQIRSIIELHHKGKSIRQTVKLSGIARNTVREYLRKIKSCRVPVEHLLALDDDALSAIVYREEHCNDSDQRRADLKQRLPGCMEELRKRGVTRYLLWMEYREAQPGGYSYSQFCEHIMQHLKTGEAVMHFTHHPGEQMMVDFAGDKLSYVDADTGEVHSCEVLVCVLPYSGFTYAEALRSQKQEDFISGINHALACTGGVPQSIKCDNMKVAVVKANRYEPSFTEAMEYVAQHYGVTLLAARVRKPRDKASVENAVGNVYRRIYAPLRDQIFFSIEQLNGAIRKQLDWHNSLRFKGKNYSRRELFEREEKPLLKTLPSTAYQIKHTTSAKVQKNYHVILGEDYHQYSVPFTLIGKQLKLVYTLTSVEIYDGQKRVAVHMRSYKKHGYTTCKEHMPLNHQHMATQRGWNADYFRREATALGPAVLKVIDHLVSSKVFLEQTYNSCLGILRLGKKYGNERLESACKRALQSPLVSYRIVDNILRHGLDQSPSLFEETGSLPSHNNVRGAAAYQ